VGYKKLAIFEDSAVTTEGE